MHATPAAEPDLLLTFVAVAETLSFSKAAVRLGVSKGTVSRKIARLEELTGVELVRRTTHHVVLSASGRDLHERASLPLRELATLLSELPDRDAGLTGLIRITVPVALAVTVVAELIDQFGRRHPGVRVDMSCSNQPLDLVANDIDVAIRVAGKRLPDSGLIARRVGDVRAGFYASPDYLARRGEPRALGDEAHDWLAFAPREAHERGGKRSGKHRATVDDYLVLRELIRRGMGVGPLVHIFAEPFVRDGSIVRVLEKEAPIGGAHIYLVTASSRAASRRVEAFLAHLVKGFSAFPAPP